ncbi:MAG: DUF4352 domain-containing protein [Parcubacteria group bacterium]|nr:DUF4352 domain-containing protein [Parcubacteria group bacterium]
MDRRHTVGKGVSQQPTLTIPTPSKRLIIGIGLAIILIAAMALIAVTIALTTSSPATDTAAVANVQEPAVANTDQQVSPNGVQAQTSEPTGDFTRPADAVRIGEFLITVNSVSTPSGINPPEAHLKYVVIELSVQNVGTSSSTIRDIDDFTLFDSDGVRASALVGGDAESDALGELGKRLRGEYPRVEPGQTLGRVMVFKILKDTKPARLEFSSLDTGASGTIPLK